MVTSECKQARNVFRYHLGSLAFGSFIIAVIQFIRYLMKYYEKLARQVFHQERRPWTWTRKVKARTRQGNDCTIC